MCLGMRELERIAFQKLAGVQVRFQHIAAFQFPSAQNMRVFLEKNAGFGGKDQAAVVGQRTAERTESVPVQRGTDLFAI